MKTITVAFIILLFSCNNKNKEALLVKEEPTTLIKPPVNKNKDAIEGIYTALIDYNNADDCKLSLELIKTNKDYQYKLVTNQRNINGKASFKTNESGDQYVVLENMPWDEYEGDISNEGNIVETKEVEIPTEIDFFYIKDTLTLQNYGNSMNYYTKLGECGGKYIQLVKK